MYKWLILSTICAFSFTAKPLQKQAIPPEVSAEVAQLVEPYLLPENHSLKPKLDALFSQSRIIHDMNTLKKAKFSVKKGPKWDQVIVAKHDKLKGYRLKLYTDTQIGVPDWYMWVKRIEGANLIRDAIQKHGYKKTFKVPKKWIYVLPDLPEAPGTHKKHFVMVVEDMNLESKSVNKMMWEDCFVLTTTKLKALHHLLTELGLIDSIYIDNTPFSKDGRIAFIDTEHYNKWPVHYNRLLPNICPIYHNFWMNLSKNPN